MAEEAAKVELVISPKMVASGVATFYACADAELGAVPESRLAELAVEVFAAMAREVPATVSRS